MDLDKVARKSFFGVPELSPSQVWEHRAELRLVDVRERSEFNGPLGNVPGSELVPLASLQGEAAGWDREQAIALICRSGARSGNATRMLRGMGFKHVYNMKGGMMRYGQEGLPTKGPRT